MVKAQLSAIRIILCYNYRMVSPITKRGSIAFIICCCFFNNIILLGQTNYLNILESLVEKPFDPKWQATEGAWQSISKLSPGHQLSLIDSLDKNKIAAKYPTKIMMLKARFSRAHMVSIDGKDWIYWGNEAIKNAVSENNNYLLEDACALLGDGYLWITRKDTALFYLLKALEIGENLGYEPAVMARRKVAASNALYQTQNYRECLDFCLAAIPFADDFDLISRITMFNNIGLSYLRTRKPDSTDRPRPAAPSASPDRGRDPA